MSSVRLCCLLGLVAPIGSTTCAELHLMTQQADGVVVVDKHNVSKFDVGWEVTGVKVLSNGVWSDRSMTSADIVSSINLYTAVRVKYQRRDLGGQPDFNSPKLSLGFFTFRGLNKHSVYGCSSENNVSQPFQFGASCACPTAQRCSSRDFNYMWQGVGHSAPMGQCGCCSAWVFVLIACVPIIFFLVVLGVCKRSIAKVVTKLLGGRERAAAKYKVLAKTKPHGASGPGAEGSVVSLAGVSPRSGSASSE